MHNHSFLNELSHYYTIKALYDYTPTTVIFTNTGDCQLGSSYQKTEQTAWFLAWGGSTWADAVGWPAGVNYEYNTVSTYRALFRN